MIIRIMEDGQYEVEEGHLDRINAIDEKVTQAAHDHDEEGFHQHLEELIQAVHQEGSRLPDDYLGTSDIVIPPADFTIEEAHDFLKEDGLVPGHAVH